MYRTSVVLSLFLFTISLSAYSQACVGESRTFVCPGTSNRFVWGVNPSTGVVRTSPSARDCTVTYRFDAPGTYSVLYTDLNDSGNDQTYTVNVIQVAGGTVNSSVSDVCPGGSATLTLTGKSGNVVRWEQSPDDYSWQTISHTGTSFTASNLTSATYFRAVVYACGSEAASTSKLISIRDPRPGYLDVISGSPSYCQGASTTFTVQWTPDGSGMLQWFEYRQKTGDVWGSWQTQSGGMHGTNQIDFTISSPTEIRALVNSLGCDVYTGTLSAAGAIPATVAGVINISTGEYEVCRGQVFSLSLTGNVGTVQGWYIRDEQHAWGNLGSTSNISIHTGTYFKVIVQNQHCAPQEREIYVGIKPVAVGTFNVSPQSICPGAPITLSVSSYTGTKVQWQRSLDGGASWETVAETTGTSYTHSGQQHTARWRAVAVNVCNDLAPTSNILVTVNRPVGGTTVGTPASVCPNTGSSLTVQGYTGNIVRWEQSLNGTNWQPIAHTAATYSSGNLQQDTYFRAVIGLCSLEEPALAQKITVKNPNAGSISSSGPGFCQGSSGVITVTWTPDETQGGILRYFQYRVKTGETWGDWQPVPGQLHDTYSVDVTVSAPTEVQAYVSTQGCNANTGVLSIPGGTPPTIAGVLHTSTGETEVCSGQPFSLVLTGNRGSVIQWWQRDEEHDWGVLSSPDNISITRPHYYKADVRNGNCSMEETIIHVGIKSAPSGDLSPAQQKICPGEKVYISLANFSGISIKWQRLDQGASTWQTVAQNTNTSFVSEPVTVTGLWRALIVHDCGETPADPVEVLVASPVPAPVTSGVNICPGNTATLSVNNPQPQPVRYHWYTYANGQYAEIYASYSNEFLVTGLSASTTYYVAFEIEGCTGPKSALTVNVFDVLSIPATPYTTITVDPVYNVTLHKNNPAGNNVTYYWQTTPDGTAQSSSADAIDMPAPGLYYVRGKNINGCWSSSSDPVDVINHQPVQYQYPISEINYVRTYTFQEPSTTTSYPQDLDTENDPDKLSVTTTYIEGLGRPIQQVSKKGSATRQDLVTPVDYDPAGRKLSEYLPYAASSDGSGNLKINPFPEQRSFYDAAPKTAQSYFPFSYEQIERSPLDNPQASFAPGEDWAGRAGSVEGKAVQHHRLVNTLEDNVRLWEVDANGLPVTSGVYSAGKLFLQETVDEQGSRTREFKTKENVTMLKRTQVAEGVWADTYYIYDDFGNLVMVLPPEGVKKIEEILNQN